MILTMHARCSLNSLIGSAPRLVLTIHELDAFWLRCEIEVSLPRPAWKSGEPFVTVRCFEDILLGDAKEFVQGAKELVRGERDCLRLESNARWFSLQARRLLDKGCQLVFDGHVKWVAQDNATQAERFLTTLLDGASPYEFQFAFPGDWNSLEEFSSQLGEAML